MASFRRIPDGYTIIGYSLVQEDLDDEKKMFCAVEYGTKYTIPELIAKIEEKKIIYDKLISVFTKLYRDEYFSLLPGNFTFALCKNGSVWLHNSRMCINGYIIKSDVTRVFNDVDQMIETIKPEMEIFKQQGF